MRKMLFHLFIICLIGVITGIVAASLGVLLKIVQHLAYGYAWHDLMGPETFLQGVQAAPPFRRFWVLVICGLVAGIGWWALHRYCRPFISIEKAVSEKKIMPFFTTTIHVLLQIITVGLGSPLGREKAPREIAASIAGYITQKAHLTPSMCRILTACAAGAGLATIYDIPYAGALYGLEYLLASFNWTAVIPAFLMAGIATVVSWFILPPHLEFVIPHLALTHTTLFWAICCGPIIGYCAFWFKDITQRASQRAPKNWQVISLCILNFTFIGFLAIFLPVLLGNGKSVVQVELMGAGTLSLALTLFVLRLFITWSSIRAGADGGILTPSLANGALLGVILGHLWNLFLPEISISICAILGATAFLAAAQKMPLTAIALTFEFTQLPVEFAAPMLLIIGTALMSRRLLTSRTA